MGKSILVMDTPEKCVECPLCVFERRCQAKEEILLPSNIRGGKPNWCPLQDAPDYKEVSDDPYSVGNPYDYGWNACLSKILNGG